MTENAWSNYIDAHHRPDPASVAQIRVPADALRRAETAVLEKLGVPRRTPRSPPTCSCNPTCAARNRTAPAFC